MTVIAWDGKVIAADKQVTYGSAKRTATKMFDLGNEILAFSGTAGTALRLLEWYKNGADLKEYPYDLQMGDEWCNLIVASPCGVKYMDRQPYFQEVEDGFAAWGIGADFAIGAMAMGADAIRAVEIACRWGDGCGMGVQYFEVHKRRPKE